MNISKGLSDKELPHHFLLLFKNVAIMVNPNFQVIIQNIYKIISYLSFVIRKLTVYIAITLLVLISVVIA